MNVTIRTKSHLMFEERMSDVRVEVGNLSYIASGVIEVSDSLLKQIEKDAHQFGSWEAAMSMKLTAKVDDRYLEHEIRLQELPVTKSISFVTTNV
jgi:hypothetical protein